MSLDRLNEAFKLLDTLNEEMFDTSLDGINKLSSAMDGDNEDDIIKIIDADAETEEEVQDSYIGKVIINCNVCHSHIFANKEDITIDDSGIVNGEEICPYCGEMEGFTVIGQIEEFGDDTTEDADDEPTDTVDDIDAPVEKPEDDNQKNESFKRSHRKALNEGGKSVDFSKIKKLGKKLIKEATDVTDQVEIDTKESGFITKKKDLEKQGYKVLHTGDGKITMAKPQELAEKIELGKDDRLVTGDDNHYLVASTLKYPPFNGAIVYKSFKNGTHEGTIEFEDNSKKPNDEEAIKRWKAKDFSESFTPDGCKLTESPYYLDTKYDSRKSFYNKAMVSDNTDELYSYGVHVMSIENGKPVIKCREDQLSQTTLRHIKEFLKQKGFPAVSKQQIIKDYMTECASGECINEDMRSSPYGAIIARHFDYTGSDRFFDVISDLIDRVDDFSNEEEIWEAIDAGLIYTRDQWEVYMHYCDMGDSTDKMYESLFGDIFAICDEISNSETPSDLDESLKSYMKTRLNKRFVEGFNNINVETDDQKLTMTQDENGKVTVSTEPLDTATPEGSGEMIAPVSDELANEIIDANSEESGETPDEGGEDLGLDVDAATEEEGTTDEEIPEEPVEEQPAEGEEPTEEEDDTANESLTRDSGANNLDEGIGDIYRKTFDKPASIDAQQSWEDELNGEAGEISDRRRKALERKFERQRDWERRHNYGAYAKTPTKNEVDMDIKDFDEVSFSTIGEKYLKNVYENVDSFEATNVANDDTTLIVEGVISFNSGVKKKTGFIFEADSATKDGSVRFVGGNKHFSKSNKAFVLEGRLDGNKLVTEALSYNYRPAKSGNRVVGRIRSK